jgi:hypothetical protein
VRKITFSRNGFAYWQLGTGAAEAPAKTERDAAMIAKSLSSLGSRPVAAALALGLSLLASGSAFALGTPEQRRACTPDVYRLCAGEIPNVRAITVCLQRHKASLSEACRSAMDQAGY